MHQDLAHLTPAATGPVRQATAQRPASGRTAATSSGVRFNGGRALISVDAAVWFRFAGLADDRGMTVARYLAEHAADAVPGLPLPQHVRPRSSPAERRLQAIADQYHRPNGMSDEVFLEWLGRQLPPATN